MKISIVGIGMGNRKTLTIGALEAIMNAGVLIGAERLLNAFPESRAEKIAAVESRKIAEIIRASEHETVAVLMSGDVGFYSGAKPLLSYLSSYDVELICGISSLVYFCSLLKTSWDDAKIVSLHGRESNICAAVHNYSKTFVLTGGDRSISAVCRLLCENDLNHVQIYVGENLSYEKERIVSGAASDFIQAEFDSLSVMLILNPMPLKRTVDVHGLSDDSFIRSDIPMTKSEIRSVSISKLQLKKSDILYDIGAGTGSVSIESAFIVSDGTVYAIEKNEKAANLIKINCEKFGTKNVRIVTGSAPDALLGLPKPDKAFIGGSSGNMDEIIGTLLGANPQIRIVVNAIALETLSETIRVFDHYRLKNIEIIQMHVSKAKELGSYHMMQAQNPIYILSCGGSDEE